MTAMKKQLKAVSTSIEPTKEYVGKIYQLKADPNAETREDAEITFIFVGEDDKATTAKVILKGTDLHNATKAFDEGKNVRIQGTLKTQGRQRFIEDALFKIIE